MVLRLDARLRQWQRWNQAEILGELAARLQPESYCEIGVADGRTLQVVVDASPRLRHLLLCDDWGRCSGGTGRGSHAHIEVLLVPYVVRFDELMFLDGRSQERLPAFIAAQQPRYTLVHVDGEHSYAGTAADLSNAWQLWPEVMVVHDLCLPEVWRAFYEFCQRELDATSFVLTAFGAHGTGVIWRDAGDWIDG